MKRTFIILGIISIAVLFSAQRFKPSTGGMQEGNGAALISPLQAAVLKNSEQTSSAATAQTISIAAVAGQSVYLYGIEVHSSAAPATPCSVTIKDGVGGTVIWSSSTTYVTANTATQTFPTPLSSTNGNGMDVVVSTCGTAITSTLDVQASQF